MKRVLFSLLLAMSVSGCRRVNQGDGVSGLVDSENSHSASCDPGMARCQGNVLQQCRGGVWTDGTDCALKGESCIELEHIVTCSGSDVARDSAGDSAAILDTGVLDTIDRETELSGVDTGSDFHSDTALTDKGDTETVQQSDTETVLAQRSVCRSPLFPYPEPGPFR